MAKDPKDVDDCTESKDFADSVEVLGSGKNPSGKSSSEKSSVSFKLFTKLKLSCLLPKK
jgi:hypothetical protein